MSIPELVGRKKGSIASRYLEAINNCGANDVSALSINSFTRLTPEKPRRTSSKQNIMNDSSCGMTAPTAALNGSSSWTTMDTRARSVDTRSRSEVASRSSRSRNSNVRRIRSAPQHPPQLGIEDETSSIESSESQRRNRPAHLSLEMDHSSCLDTSFSSRAINNSSFSSQRTPERSRSANNSSFSSRRTPERARSVNNTSLTSQLTPERAIGNPRKARSWHQTVFPMTSPRRPMTQQYSRPGTTPNGSPSLLNPYSMRRTGTLHSAQTRHPNPPMEGSEVGEAAVTEVMHNLTSTPQRYDNSVVENAESESGAMTEVATNRMSDVLGRLNRSARVGPSLMDDTSTQESSQKRSRIKSLMDDTSTQESSHSPSYQMQISSLMDGGLSSSSNSAASPGPLNMSRLAKHVQQSNNQSALENGITPQDMESNNTGNSSIRVETGVDKISARPPLPKRFSTQQTTKSPILNEATMRARLHLAIRGLKQQSQPQESHQSLHDSSSDERSHPSSKGGQNQSPDPEHPEDETSRMTSESDKHLEQSHQSLNSEPSDPSSQGVPSQRSPQQERPHDESTVNTSHTSDTDLLLEQAMSNVNGSREKSKSFVIYNDRKQENVDEVFQKRSRSLSGSDHGTQKQQPPCEVSNDGETPPIQPLFSLDRLDFSVDSQSPIRKWHSRTSVKPTEDTVEEGKGRDRSNQYGASSRTNARQEAVVQKKQHISNQPLHSVQSYSRPESISFPSHENVLSPVSCSTAERSPDNSETGANPQINLPEMNKWRAGPSYSDQVEEELVQIMDQSNQRLNVNATAKSEPSFPKVTTKHILHDLEGGVEVRKQQPKPNRSVESELPMSKLPSSGHGGGKEPSTVSVKDQIRALNHVNTPKWKKPVPIKVFKPPAPADPARKTSVKNYTSTAVSTNHTWKPKPNKTEEEKKVDGAPFDLSILEAELSAIAREDDDTASVRSLREIWERKSTDDHDIVFEDDDDEDCASVKSLRDKLERRANEKTSTNPDEDDAGSVKSLREMFDAPPKRNNDKVSRMRALFEANKPLVSKTKNETYKSSNKAGAYSLTPPAKKIDLVAPASNGENISSTNDRVVPDNVPHHDTVVPHHGNVLHHDNIPHHRNVPHDELPSSHETPFTPEIIVQRESKQINSHAISDRGHSGATRKTENRNTPDHAKKPHSTPAVNATSRVSGGIAIQDGRKGDHMTEKPSHRFDDRITSAARPETANSGPTGPVSSPFLSLKDRLQVFTKALGAAPVKKPASQNRHDRLNKWANRHQVSKRSPLAAQVDTERRATDFPDDEGREIRSADSYDLSSVAPEKEPEHPNSRQPVAQQQSRSVGEFFSKTNKAVRAKQKQEEANSYAQPRFLNRPAQTPDREKLKPDTPYNNASVQDNSRQKIHAAKKDIFRIDDDKEELRESVPGNHWVQTNQRQAPAMQQKNSTETEYSDGVTLDVSIAEISILTDPTAIRSKESKDRERDHESSSGSSAIELAAKKSEASSSQLSEAAAPLITGAMRLNPMSDEMSREIKHRATQKAKTDTNGNPKFEIENGKDRSVDTKNSEVQGTVEWDICRVEDSFPFQYPSSDNFLDAAPRADHDPFPDVDWPAFDHDDIHWANTEPGGSTGKSKPTSSTASTPVMSPQEKNAQAENWGKSTTPTGAVKGEDRRNYNLQKSKSEDPPIALSQPRITAYPASPGDPPQTKKSPLTTPPKQPAEAARVSLLPRYQMAEKDPDNKQVAGLELRDEELTASHLAFMKQRTVLSVPEAGRPPRSPPRVSPQRTDNTPQHDNSAEAQAHVPSTSVLDRPNHNDQKCLGYAAQARRSPPRENHFSQPSDAGNSRVSVPSMPEVQMPYDPDHTLRSSLHSPSRTTPQRTNRSSWNNNDHVSQQDGYTNQKIDFSPTRDIQMQEHQNYPSNSSQYSASSISPGRANNASSWNTKKQSSQQDQFHTIKLDDPPIPAVPSRFDPDYEAIMESRHQMLLSRQRSHQQKRVARENANLRFQERQSSVSTSGTMSSWSPVDRFDSGVQETRSPARRDPPITNPASNPKFFGRTHPNSQSPSGTPSSITTAALMDYGPPRRKDRSPAYQNGVKESVNAPNQPRFQDKPTPTLYNRLTSTLGFSSNRETTTQEALMSRLHSVRQARLKRATALNRSSYQVRSAIPEPHHPHPVSHVPQQAVRRVETARPNLAHNPGIGEHARQDPPASRIITQEVTPTQPPNYRSRIAKDPKAKHFGISDDRSDATSAVNLMYAAMLDVE